MADAFGMPLSTVCRTVHGVLEVLMDILVRVIHFPRAQEMEEVGAGIARLAGFLSRGGRSRCAYYSSCGGSYVCCNNQGRTDECCLWSAASMAPYHCQVKYKLGAVGALLRAGGPAVFREPFWLSSRSEQQGPVSRKAFPFSSITPG
ncbi:unnamed protein product [Arctogadus glacialis]